MEKQDDAGYYAAMLPLKKNSGVSFSLTRRRRNRLFPMLLNIPDRLQKQRKEHSVQVFIYNAYKKLGAHPVVSGGVHGTSFCGMGTKCDPCKHSRRF